MEDCEERPLWEKRPDEERRGDEEGEDDGGEEARGQEWVQGGVGGKVRYSLILNVLVLGKWLGRSHCFERILRSGIERRRELLEVVRG